MLRRRRHGTDWRTPGSDPRTPTLSLAVGGGLPDAEIEEVLPPRIDSAPTSLKARRAARVFASWREGAGEEREKGRTCRLKLRRPLHRSGRTGQTTRPPRPMRGGHATGSDDLCNTAAGIAHPRLVDFGVAARTDAVGLAIARWSMVMLQPVEHRADRIGFP